MRCKYAPVQTERALALSLYAFIFASSQYSGRRCMGARRKSHALIFASHRYSAFGTRENCPYRFPIKREAAVNESFNYSTVTDGAACLATPMKSATIRPSPMPARVALSSCVFLVDMFPCR
ncbi:unnamed protein product, partial [Iphiclides podalirius]